MAVGKAISDAIRWVLGEQSIKSLRGNKMEDVIFSGTDNRRALGFAEVAIFFDNTDKFIPVDFTEVSVTRRMFRSGESEYYINKSSCRLKDVRSLFMDTGIGKDGYSIIGQGKIDEVLSNKPEDRRNIFEEAAGIIKYKSKKEETEKKLDKTHENLVRIKDLISEIDSQYDYLEVESKKATEFVNLYEELKVLDINQSIREIDKLKLQMENLEIEINLDSNEIENLLFNKVDSDKRLKELKDYIKDVEEKHQEYRDSKVDLIQSIEQNKNKINLINEKSKYHNKDIERCNKDIHSLKKNMVDLDSEINNLKEEIHKVNVDYTEINENHRVKEEEFSSLESIIEDKEKSLESEKASILKIYNNISDYKSLLHSIDTFQDNIKKRLSQLNNDNVRVHDDKALNEDLLREINNEDLDLRQKLIGLTDDKDTLEETRKKLDESYENLINNARGIEVKLQGLSSSYNLYKGMEEGYEGYYKSVKNIIQAINNKRLNKKGYEGVIVDLLKVEAKYEKAIEVSLGSSLQNIVVEDEASAKVMINYLKENKLGRVTFLPRKVIKGNPLSIDENKLKEFGFIGLAHTLIDYDEKYENIFESLLGRTIIVDSIDNAIKLANKFYHTYRIVTLEGDLLNPGGSLTGGSYSNNAISIISRKNRIAEIEEEIKKLTINNDILEDKKINLSKDIENNKSILNAIVKEIKDLEISLLNNSNNKNSYLKEIERLEKEILRIDEEIISLENESREYLAQKSEYEKSILELEDKSNFLNKVIRDLNLELSKDKTIKEEKRKELTDYKIKLNHVENNLNNLDLDLRSKIKNKEEKLDTKMGLESEIEKTISEIENLKEEENKIQEIIEKISLEYEDVSLKLEEFISSKESLMNDYYEEQESLKTINDRLMDLEKQKSKRELRLSKLELQEENINDKLYNDYELNYEMAISLKLYSEDLIISKNRIVQLKEMIKSLGNVNVGAIEEFNSIKERLTFINKQYNDLIKSKENLEQLIKEMENTMKEQFLISFKEINENFSKVFASLFNGGKATLELDCEEDLLKSGIEIKVQPPGKKLQNLNLLSGGERSLTAVALLFAILETKPSPFCVLDEIDAALDEANIGRYTRYLKQFSHKTQFILITHRKTTMEISDILYGVTMAEEGVSKLISVKIKDYSEDLVV